MIRLFQIAVAVAIVTYVYPMITNFIATLDHVSSVLN